MIKELMSHNIYEFENNLVVCGSCLPDMDKEAFEKVKSISENIFFVCLEIVHMNMLAHKLASILRIGKVKNLIFVSVDKSPHCVQLHYLRSELEKIMRLDKFKISNYVADAGNLVEILPETISLSKNLGSLSKLNRMIYNR